MDNAIRFQTDKFPWWEGQNGPEDGEDLCAGRELAEYLGASLPSWGLSKDSGIGEDWGWLLLPENGSTATKIEPGFKHEISIGTDPDAPEGEQGHWAIFITSKEQKKSLGFLKTWKDTSPNQQLLEDIAQALSSLGVSGLQKFEF